MIRVIGLCADKQKRLKLITETGGYINYENNVLLKTGFAPPVGALEFWATQRLSLSLGWNPVSSPGRAWETGVGGNTTCMSLLYLEIIIINLACNVSFGIHVSWSWSSSTTRRLVGSGECRLARSGHRWCEVTAMLQSAGIRCQSLCSVNHANPKRTRFIE